jgi:hypothetical protein
MAKSNNGIVMAAASIGENGENGENQRRSA